MKKKISELTIIPVKRHLNGGTRYGMDELETGEIIDDMGNGRGYDKNENQWSYIPGMGWANETMDNIDWREILEDDKE